MVDNAVVKEILVTKDGYKKLVKELEDLKNVKRREVAARIKEAISYGDLSENSEYEEAKNEQAFVEGRILDLEYKVKNATVIDDKKKKSGKIVQLGSTVTVKNITKRSKNTEVYVIVGSTESDYENKISNESPVGSALLEKTVGERVKVSAPIGVIEYEIVNIKQ